VYEPRIEPEELREGARSGTIVRRQSLLRNVVTENDAVNVYVFGIDPKIEQQVSTFRIAAGRFLTENDENVAVVDQASAQALGVRVGDSFPVRTAADTDLSLTVIGIVGSAEFYAPPLATVPAPALQPGAAVVTSGVFVPLRTSEEIFARSTLTDALVIAPSLDDVPGLTDHIRQQFRLNTGVFVEESYTRYLRKVRDFRLTLALFRTVGGLSALLASAVVAALLYDVYLDRRHQYAVLAAVGFRPFHLVSIILVPGLLVAILGATIGTLIGVLVSPRHFQMPSLLADMGPVTPRLDGAVAGVLIVVAFAGVLAGVMRPIWIVIRGPIAPGLRKDES
jgi:ABC-type lipoprotein release transport system permease subunit